MIAFVDPDPCRCGHPVGEVTYTVGYARCTHCGKALQHHETPNESTVHDSVRFLARPVSAEARPTEPTQPLNRQGRRAASSAAHRENRRSKAHMPKG